MRLSANAQWSLDNRRKTSGMTLTSLITLNAILATVVVSGIVWLLASAVGADRSNRLTRQAAHRARPGRAHRPSAA